MTREDVDDLQEGPDVPGGTDASAAWPGAAPGRPPRRDSPARASSARDTTSRRAGERSRPDRWKVVFLVVLVSGLLGLVAWLLLGSRVLVVRQVEVTGTHLVPRDRVVAAARVRLGVPMIRLNVDAVGDRVEGTKGVESARIERRWPATVRIVVRERVPVVTVERGGRYHQLDRFGVIVLDTSDRPAGLPVLLTPAPGPADPATRAALEVRQGLPARYATKLLTIEASTAESVTLRLATGKTVIWGSVERLDEKIRLVDALLGNTAGRTARTIDVSSPEVVTTQ